MQTVAVLRGGASPEHDVSLKTGAQVLAHVRESYKPLDVYIDRNGVWHVRGIPMAPERALGAADVVFNALHGAYGEDGNVQRVLDRIGIPYTGSGAYASAVAMNKILTKELLAGAGVKTPRSVTLSVSPTLDEEIVALFRSFPQPCVVKPADAGSSLGVMVARSFESFREAIKKAFQYSKQVIVEEYVKGKEATAGVVDWLRGEVQYRLPPVEIVPKAGSGFFDYEAKYGGESEERCPGTFTRAEAEELQRLAGIAHQTLGLRHYSRSDFIVTPKGIYFLETNTLPGLTEASLLPKSLAAVGVSVPEFVDHVLDLALRKG